MKVLLLNGSPHEKGCTFTALEEVAGALRESGVETELYWIGNGAIAGCAACGHCKKNKICVHDDQVNRFLEIAERVDGFVFGSPVHYASAGGSIIAFLDRVFYAASCSGRRCFYLKPAAAVVSARRAGTTAAFDQLNKYFTISQMPVISSQYWNMVHGYKPDEVRQDLEGLQTMRVLGRNMAWFLHCKEAGKKAGVPLPEREETQRTNFIR